MDKLTAIKIKYDDGTCSDEIPISALSENVLWDSTHTLVDVLGSIDVAATGTIQDQISQLFNEKVSNSDMQAYVTNSMPTYITSWLNTNVNPVGSAVVVDSSLTVSGAAADAKVVGDNLNDLKSTLNDLADTQTKSVFNRTVSSETGYLEVTNFNISAGTYNLHVDSVESSAIGTKSFVLFYSNSTKILDLALDRNIQIDQEISLSADITKIAFYASSGWNESVGKTFSFNNFNIYSKTELGERLDRIEANVDANIDAINVIEDSEDDLKKGVFDYIISQVYPGSISSGFVTSVFSGWITDYIALRNINAVKFVLPIKARATAITGVRVFYGKGSFIDAGTNHIDLSVNIPANTKKDIEFECRLSVEENDHFYIGYACNQKCDMQWVDVNSDVVAYGGSCYTTNGIIPDNSKYGISYSTTSKNMLYIVEAENKITKPITQDRLSFAEFIEPKNLLNINNTDECKKGYWYYTTSVDSIVSAQETEYTYTALKAKVYDASKITIGAFPQISPNPPRIYWVGAVDKDMKLLSYSIVNAEIPITYNIPEGTVYILASLQSKADSVLDKMMIVKGETISKYAKGVGEWWKLKQCITESEEKVDVSYLKLPASYDLVVGDTFQLFKKGILDVVNSDLYDIKFTCSKGSAYDRFFELTPSTAETLVLYIDVYGEEHQLIDSGSVNLVIRSKKSSPSENKNILCVGDSLTTGGDWPKEFYRRLTGSGGSPSGDGLTNISFIGTRENQGVHYEGYGGWKFSSYNNATTDINAKVITCVHDKTIDDQHSTYKDANNAVWKLETIESGSIKIIAVSGNYGAFPSTGTLTWVSGGVNHSDIVYTASENAPGNPFWDTSANKVDFASYCSRIGASGIDYVFVLLGWNDAAASESSYKQQAQTFIDNVHASYPNAKIVLMGLQIPAKDGLGVNYGATGIYSDFYQLMNYVYNLDSWYADIAEDDATVYSINVSGQFDTEHNMPESTRPVNTRNATTETYQTNGVHPATPGYLQIADAAYRAFMGL